MSKKVDNLEGLTLDMLNTIALKLPMEDVASFCFTSKSLAKICKQESFWADRLMQDFPLYPAPRPLPSGLTYHNYYRELWRVFNLKDNSNRSIFNDVPLSRGDERLLLSYPVPRFVLDVNNNIRPDISIDRFSKDVVIVSIKNRYLRTGKPFPNLLSNIPLINVEDLPSTSRLVFNEVARDGKRWYDEFYLVPSSEYNNLLKAAKDLGFKMLLAQDISNNIRVKVNPEDSDLFFQRMDRVLEKKPSPRQQQMNLQPVESPPVPRNKVKKLFGFLPSSD